GLHWLQWIAIVVLGLPMVAYLAMQMGFDLLGDVRVRGIPIARGEAGVAALRLYADHWGEEIVTIHAGPYVARFRRNQLGTTLPIDRLSRRLMTLGKTGFPTSDLAALFSSYSGGIDFALSPTVDQTALVTRLAELRSRLERRPVPGMIMNDGRALPGIPGVTLDLVDAVEHVERALRNEQIDATLAIRSVPPPLPVVFGQEGDERYGVEMISFETTYRTGGAATGRAHNIETAVARLDGTMIPPSGELSFNGVVGERSYARGFAGAKEIASKRIVDGVGGGVCQVAATLHAAAFLAGFDLPEYRPHSRPAHYIALGLDTMVAWPSQDMRIANPYPFPVRVRAKAQDGVLRISLDGAGKAYLVEWSTQIVQRIKPGTQELPDRSLGPGEREVIQQPIDGLNVRRLRTIYLPTGVRKEDVVLRYPPNDRIVAVGSSNGDEVASSRVRNESRYEGEDF
ncbi:MAG TPA: VanW family protein, partial [Polyangiales bacterium]